MKLIHCSYHKCLTVYYAGVMSYLFNRLYRWSKGYRHFNSMLGEFYQEHDRYKVASVNNHGLDFARIGENFRLTRFVRDPRDLIVSGYFYHRRGAEPWCDIVDPTEADWLVVNGTIPAGMGAGHSYTTYLQSLDEEDGLIAEIEFRRKHYESMKQWPMGDQRIRIFKYEEFLGNELDVFREIFEFYGLSWPTRKLGLLIADHLSMAKQKGKTRHIRDPKPNQWKKYFTPRVEQYFNERYGDLLVPYGYDRG